MIIETSFNSNNIMYHKDTKSNKNKYSLHNFNERIIFWVLIIDLIEFKTLKKLLFNEFDFFCSTYY